MQPSLNDSDKLKTVFLSGSVQWHWLSSCPKATADCRQILLPSPYILADPSVAHLAHAVMLQEKTTCC